MNRVTRTLAAGLVLSLAGAVRLGAQPAAQTPTLRASLAVGSIQGTVRDASGRALEGALVSALGATSAVATTDSLGQFMLRGLPSGSYILRAHRNGFAASERQLVELRPNGRLVRSIQLVPLGVDPLEVMSVPPVLAAGLTGAAQPVSSPADDTASTTGDHPHTPIAWRLRHLKRSVLRDATGLPVEYTDGTGEFRAGDASPGTWFSWAVESSARLATSLFDSSLTGEINLLTTSSFEPREAFSGHGLPRGVAFIALSAPAGSGDWSMRAAVTGGDVSSWILSGAYSARAHDHAYDVGLSYGTQAFKGGRTAPLSDLADDSRNVGAVYGYDRWAVSRAFEVTYGARWARHDYVEQPNMLSPRLGVSVSPLKRTHVRAFVSQRMLAPGAEEFLPPPAAGLWLPPERTFSPLGSNRFRVERVRTLEVSLEREFDRAFVVAVRRFYQSADDQLATLFGVHGAGFISDAGHYYVATAGAVDSDGWAVSLSSPVAGRIRGRVDYRVMRARWTPSSEAALIRALAPSAARADTEDIHDVTTSLEAAIPETATRVHFVYRMNTAFARADGDALPGLDGRFDLLVNQGLPFRLVSAEWEVLVGVRNLFRELGEMGSTYDELLVVRPPTRLVGGVLVRF